MLYDRLQQRRWDHDWPALFQWLAGIAEGLFLYGLLWVVAPIRPLLPSFSLYAAHYATVWLDVFICSQSVMRRLFPRWRYRVGQWLPSP